MDNAKSSNHFSYIRRLILFSIRLTSSYRFFRFSFEKLLFKLSNVRSISRYFSFFFRLRNEHWTKSIEMDVYRLKVRGFCTELRLISLQTNRMCASNERLIAFIYVQQRMFHLNIVSLGLGFFFLGERRR